MSEASAFKPVTNSVVTEMATPAPAVDPKATKTLQKEEKRRSTGPSRRTLNTLFNITRSVNRVHQIVHPSSADFDDGDDNDDDNDDDEDDEDDDRNVEDIQDGDEPLSEQQFNQTTSDSHTDTSHETAHSHVASASHLISHSPLVNNERDSNVARYQFSPEKPDSLTAPKGPPKSEQTGVRATQLPAASHPKTLNAPATVATVDSGTAKLATQHDLAVLVSDELTSVPTLKPIVAAQARPEQNTVKSLPAAATTQSSTTPPSQYKVDPLAPTVAAPYGYKIITVKRPDGTIAKVKRPLKQGEQATSVSTKALTRPSAQKSTTTTTDNADSRAVLEIKEKVTSTLPTAPRTISDTKDAEVSPSKTVTSTTTKLLDVSEKDIGGVQVIETELESPTTSQAATGELFKGARRFAKVVKVFIWTVAIIFPLFFLGLGVATATMNNKKVPERYSSNSSTFDGTYSKPKSKLSIDQKDPLNQAITVAASAWPIVFAAIVAQSLKMYAAYKVERGIKLVTLEQLISSHSVGGAIKQPFMLRTFNWTTLILFFIWCLSPLAGQAILRMSTTADISELMNTTVSYFSAQTGGQGPPLSWVLNDGDDDMNNMRDRWSISNVITSALLQDYAQTQTNSQDIYRNARIPAALGTTITSNLRIDSHHRSDEIIYPSLLGSPFWIMDESESGYMNLEQSTEFEMISSYFSFNCSDWEIVDAYGPITQSHNLTYGYTGWAVSAENNTLGSYYQSVYANSSGVFPDGPPSNASYPSLNTKVEYMQPGPEGTLYLTSSLVANFSKDPQLLFSQCSYRNFVVNTTMDCISVAQYATCGSSFLGSLEISDPKYPPVSLGYWFPLALEFFGNTGSEDWGEVEYFLSDPEYASHRDYSGHDTGSSLRTVTGAQLSERLNLVVNALWSAQLDVSAYVGTGQPTWFNRTAIDYAPARATKPTITIYVVSRQWVGVLLACSVLLLLAAVTAAIWESRVVGPDFLGFANTVIKKSVKIPKSTSMSTLDARDRLHALQECEVLLQDVRPDHPIGRIALGVKEDTSTRLIAGRRYK